MNLEEARKLLEEANPEAYKVMSKELETQTNKGQGVEAERKKAEDTKKELDDIKTTHATEVANLENKIEAARAEWKSDTDGFKKLYDDNKLKLDEALKNNSNSTLELEELKKAKTDFEALMSADIEKLYDGLEEDDVKTLKSLAEKYPIQERVAFIVDFKEKYLGITKKKWGKANWGSWGSVTTMEDIQAEYDKLSALPVKSKEQQKALIRAARYISWELKLPTT